MKMTELAGRWVMLAGILGGFLLTGPKPVEAAEDKSKPASTNAATIVFQGHFPQTRPEEKEPALIYSLQADTAINVQTNRLLQTSSMTVWVLQGTLKEFEVAVDGSDEIYLVAGDSVGSWGVRHGGKNERRLFVRIREDKQSQTNFAFTVRMRQEVEQLPRLLTPSTFHADQAAFFSGSLRVTHGPELEVEVQHIKNLTRVEEGEGGKPAAQKGKPKDPAEDRDRRYTFAGSGYHLKLNVQEADPELRRVLFEDFDLTGEIDGDTASFHLTGKAVVRHRNPGHLQLLAGAVALTESAPLTNATIRLLKNSYIMEFAEPGTYPIDLHFNAQVRETGSWKVAGFTVPSAALRPVTLKGLAEDTQVQFVDAARAERRGDAFASHLPASGPLVVRWQEARPESEGKLFFAVNGVSEVALGPGLIRQTAHFDFQIMQGALQTIALRLEGGGEVTRVEGVDILSWRTEEGEEGARRLVVQLNQPQKRDYSLIVQTQRPLGEFPVTVAPLRITPEGAVRFGGYLRVVNDGAVRLEVGESTGMTQISPQRFPQTQALGGVREGQQVFTFRFSGTDFTLSLQADTILPEISVSQVLVYHLGETETAIQAELELDIREAPLREFDITVPADYSLSQLNAPSLADYVLQADPGGASASLKLQFAQPLSGRQVIQVRLTHNHDTPPASWALPKFEPRDVKSLRGFVGVSADPGWRLVGAEVSGVVEIATAFFPKKLDELQLSYRLREASWSITADSERLELSVQVDTLQLFSIGEGIAYGSTVFNYSVARAPVSVFRVNVPTNYSNVEFVGREIRNWTQTNGVYEVELHTPVSGTYSLLATYDVQFNPLGAELSFEGLQPLDVQSEQGHVLVVSAYQFRVVPQTISPGLIRLEPGEIPTEYRLLFDAPILAAYQFTARPFEVSLELAPIGQGGTVDQVVDRATFKTRISSEGEALTEATYMVKNKGYSHLRLRMPEGARLWSATIEGRQVIPVTDRSATLIPLPQTNAPNAVIPLELKFASKGGKATRLGVALPALESPILFANWELRPDNGYRLSLKSSALEPIERPGEISGFAWLAKFLDGRFGGDARSGVGLAIGAILVGAFLWRRCTRNGARFLSRMNLLGLIAGLLGIGIGAWILWQTMVYSSTHPLAPGEALAFTIPVQAPGSMLAVDVANREIGGFAMSKWPAWPVIPGMALWLLSMMGASGAGRAFGVSLAWTLMGWGTLRLPHGSTAFFGLLLVFLLLHVLIPLLVRQWSLPRAGGGGGAKAATAGAAALAFLLALFGAGATEARAAAKDDKEPLVHSVEQTVRVEKDVAAVDAHLVWEVREKGERLDFLAPPAVLVEVRYPGGAMKLEETPRGREAVQRLIAEQTGSHTIRFSYQVKVEAKDGLSQILLPARHGLINRVRLELDRGDLEAVSPDAVSVKRLDTGTEGTSAFELVLTPVERPNVGWRPRSRDTRAEKTVFYAEHFQLLAPSAGVIEGFHLAQIRPAQGQVGELVFQTPEGMTIADVQAPNLSRWRFDPDERALRVAFDPPSSKAFLVKLQSQITTGPLPFEADAGVITLADAAGQVGMAGIATTSEVQLGTVGMDKLATINLEDFPLAAFQEQKFGISGLTLRRAYRFTDDTAKLTIPAAAVQPDIRVVSQQTLSLGEDRTLLAVNLTANISRAGVFRLSFEMPDGYEVESLTGESLSHWTENVGEEGRVVTLHLKGKTLGQQAYSLSLAGPGVSENASLTAPRVSLRETDKETGQLVVVPEKGVRLHVGIREGITQLDPRKVGIRDKGVLAFRLLRDDWALGFDIEQVAPWIQVASLQDVTVQEGQVRVDATFEYEIENAGLKALSVQVPEGARSVRFTGEHIADSEAVGDAPGVWEVRLRRRVTGTYRLGIRYLLVTADQPAQVIVQSVRALNVDLHRGFLALRSGGRLQLEVPQTPASVQPVDWRSIPPSLRQAREAADARLAFRTVEADFSVGVNVIRHSAAQILPARILSAELRSVLSDSGVLITETRLVMQPGDKRLLRVSLPGQSRFWSGFVNGSSVWPWDENGDVLIPLEPVAESEDSITVEFVYSVERVLEAGGTLDFELLGPKLDLPLQNITWHVHLPPSWDLADWGKGAFHLQEQAMDVAGLSIDLESYMREETAQRQAKTRKAESMLQKGNTLLQEGQQEEARRAFQSAYSLSQHDEAFNEDARVQLQNLKLQQALVGLNFRRNAAFEDAQGAPNEAAVEILRDQQQARYTQDQAKRALAGNTAEDNQALMRVAEQLIEQQDAAIAAPDAIRASLPDTGKRYTFNRSLQVDTESDLRLELEVKRIEGDGAGRRFTMLAGLFVLMFVGALLARGRREE